MVVPTSFQEISVSIFFSQEKNSPVRICYVRSAEGKSTLPSGPFLEEEEFGFPDSPSAVEGAPFINRTRTGRRDLSFPPQKVRAAFFSCNGYKRREASPL